MHSNLQWLKIITKKEMHPTSEPASFTNSILQDIQREDIRIRVKFSGRFMCKHLMSLKNSWLIAKFKQMPYKLFKFRKSQNHPGMRAAIYPTSLSPAGCQKVAAVQSLFQHIWSSGRRQGLYNTATYDIPWSVLALLGCVTALTVS